MQGICIDAGSSNILKKDHKYFLFEHGPRNFYVSKFNNPKSHCGSFQRSRFRLIEEQVDPTDVINPRKLKRFVARVSHRHTWFTVGDEYVISEVDHNGYIHVYSKGRAHRGPFGSYLTNFFEIIGPFDESVLNEAKTEPKALKVLPKEPKAEQTPSKAVPEAPKVVEKAKRIESEQLTLF